MKLTNHIKVGVKAWNGAAAADESDEWGAAFNAMWVTIDGERVPGDIVDVKTKMSGDDFQTVTIRFIVGKFETVSSDAYELVEARMRAERGEGPKPEPVVPR